MPSVGEELRRERELRGIRLEEIADETKISVRFLEAIDVDRMDVIPGEFYRRASLRAYARYLGIDADRILASYEFQSAAKSAAPRLLQAEPRPLGDLLSARATKWAALVLAGLGLSGALVVVWLVGGFEKTPALPPALSAQRTQRNVASSIKRTEPATSPVVREEIEEVSAMELPLRLILKVNEPCWLEVHADGEITTQGLMLRGFEKEIQAEQEIRLWLGNAGGVSIWLNERPGIALGRSGQVRKDLLITPENFMDFVAADKEAEVVPVSDEES